MDINTGYQSRFSWERELAPKQFYLNYSSAAVREERVSALASIMTDTDKSRGILNSFTGEIKDGHHQIQAFSGDYSEAFTFWSDREITEEMLQSQKTIGRKLRALTESSSSPKERERMEYLTSHVEFLSPFAESWRQAIKLHKLLQEALELKKGGEQEKARSLVSSSGVPLWITLARNTREALLAIQRIVSDRNDLGTLASMHNKFERLALVRLRLSMKEFLGELPDEVEKIYQEVMRPDNEAVPRLFIPTRPAMLEAGKRCLITAVAPGPRGVIEVNLYTKISGGITWKAQSMKLKGRRTYEGYIGPVPAQVSFLDYYAEAKLAGHASSADLTAPLEAPDYYYSVTVI